MDKQRLQKIASVLEVARQQAANLKTADLAGIALRLERTRRSGSGGHLIYKSPLPGSRSLCIPNHPSKPIGKGLALKILGDLDSDVDAWEQYLDEIERL